VKVYLATSGEYSDYRVCHVFTRREDAEAYELGEDVVEFQLHDGPVEVRVWHIMYWNPGQPDHEGKPGYQLPNPHYFEDRRDYDGDPRHVEHHWVGATPQFQVGGWDLDRVRKVYSEQRAQKLAQAQYEQ
jgi:hypothetical protein